MKHHSAVELIDRLEAHGYVRRSRGRDDRRRVLVTLLPRGEKLLEQVARARIGELRASGAALVNAISALLENGCRTSVEKRTGRTSKNSKVHRVQRSARNRRDRSARSGPEEPVELFV